MNVLAVQKEKHAKYEYGMCISFRCTKHKIIMFSMKLKLFWARMEYF